MYVRRAVFLLFLFAVPALHPDVQAQSGTDVMERLRSRFEHIHSLRADFIQTIYQPDGSEAGTMQGEILLQKDRYRIETPEQTLVTDGHVTWIYNRATNQVLINDYLDDETTFSLNDFLFDFDRQYEILSVGKALLGGKEHDIVRLRPLDPNSLFREILVVVRPEDTMIRRIELTDVNETRITFDLRNHEIDPPLPPDAFVFSPPEGAEIVDLRS